MTRHSWLKRRATLVCSTASTCVTRHELYYAAALGILGNSTSCSMRGFCRQTKRKQVESRGSGHGALDRSHAAFTGGATGEGTPVAANDDAVESGVPMDGTAQTGATSTESLAHADFRHLHQPEEMRALDSLMRQFALRLRKLAVRRERSGGSLRIDMPGTARRSVSHGGQPIELAFRKRRKTTPRLVLLLDVSRSMNLYSFFFLRLARRSSGSAAGRNACLSGTHDCQPSPARCAIPIHGALRNVCNYCLPAGRAAHALASVCAV